jgi:hypothetical protein
VRLTSVVFLISTETEGIIDGHTINIPHNGAENEVSKLLDSLELAGSQVHRAKRNYCNMSPRQDTCEVINNCLVEYEKLRKINKKENTKFLEGNSHLSDDIESGKSEDMKTQKEARLCLAAICDRTETNDTTQATISN